MALSFSRPVHPYLDDRTFKHWESRSTLIRNTALGYGLAVIDGLMARGCDNLRQKSQMNQFFVHWNQRQSIPFGTALTAFVSWYNEGVAQGLFRGPAILDGTDPRELEHALKEATGHAAPCFLPRPPYRPGLAGLGAEPTDEEKAKTRNLWIGAGAVGAAGLAWYLLKK